MRSSPALAPARPSSKPGMKLPWPSTIGAPSAVPPSNASPSILPTKSTVTRSPVCAARSSSGVNVTLRSTSSPTALSMASASTSATRRSSFRPLKSASSMAGSTSKVIEYERSAWPESTRSISAWSSGKLTLGCMAGRSLRSASALLLVSRTVSCSTSTISERPYIFFRCGTGTFPLRKPLSCTRSLISSRRSVKRLPSSPAGTTTCSVRFRPSLLVSVICIVLQPARKADGLSFMPLQWRGAGGGT